MKDIEFVGAFANVAQHREMHGKIAVERPALEADCATATRDQLGRGHRISTRKQRHVVAQRDQSVGQVGNDAFGTPIKAWRH